MPSAPSPPPKRDALTAARLAAFGLAIALWSATPLAESIRILIQSSPLAGSQYHALERLRHEIRIDDILTLVREPNNRHDRFAVRVEWQGQALGYVPRAENKAVARALDAGEALHARVSALREDTNPWRRLEFAVYLSL